MSSSQPQQKLNRTLYLKCYVQYEFSYPVQERSPVAVQEVGVSLCQ